MSNNLKTAQAPPPQLKKRAFLQQQTDEDRSYLHGNFDDRLNALGIQDKPFRYMILGGKTVPSDMTDYQLFPPQDSIGNHNLPPFHSQPQPRTGPLPPLPPARNPLRPRPLSRDQAPPQNRDMYRHPTAIETSPPSSPDLDATHNGSCEDVSPIDDNSNKPGQTHHHGPKSHIPTMRGDQSKPGHPSNSLGGSRSRGQPRRNQVKPWESNPMTAQLSGVGPDIGVTTTVTGPRTQRTGKGPSSFGQRMLQFARGKPEPVESRPPWNGASERGPLSDPVPVAPLSIQKLGITSDVTPIQDYPRPLYTSAQPTRSTYSPSSLDPDALPNQQKAIKRKPSTTQDASRDSHASFSSSVYSTLSDQTITPSVSPTPAAEPSLPTEEPWTQPASRFSVTTCNTTVPDSPAQEENPPPMPAPPMIFSSVVERSRPVPGSEARKPDAEAPIVSSMESIALTDSMDTSGNKPITMCTDKELPPAPPEVQSANDRVAYLNAQLENLAHQRTNINRSIKQMTELMPMDNLMASRDVLRKREIEKKKVEGLKEDLAEIQRKEYDLGMKLYRANKRLDVEGTYESSSLWVRRVTD